MSYITIDIPQQRTVVEKDFGPALEACGKKLNAVFYPATAADLTPSIQKAVTSKSDFNFVNVLAQIGLGYTLVFLILDRPRAQQLPRL